MDQSMAVPVAFMSIWTIVTLLAIVVIRIAFALAVWGEADDMESTHLVGGGMWALATLAGGVFVAAAFWFIHNLPAILHAPTKSTEQPPPSD